MTVSAYVSDCLPPDNRHLISRFPWSRSGFTLIEMVVVMLIVALGTSVFLGYQFSQRGTLELRTSARQVVLFLRQAQSFAELKGVTNNCYYLPRTGTLSQELDEKALALSSGIKLQPAEYLKRDGKLLLTSFFADGSALLSEFDLVSQTQHVQCTVDPVLGKVAVSGIKSEA